MEFCTVKAKKSNGKKRGPVADRVKIDENWKDAMNKALKKKRPEPGWPKERGRG